MRKNPTIAYQRREFLNEDKEMSAFIIAKLSAFPTTQRGEVSSYPILDIADCSEKISLDFSFYGKEQLTSCLKKLRLFKAVVTEFADAYEKEAEKLLKSLEKKKVVKAKPKK
jgi:hypothetical protein